MCCNVYDCNDIMEILKVKQGKAYQIIRVLNKELKEQGFLIINGKVPKKYFYERFKLDNDD